MAALFPVLHAGSTQLVIVPRPQDWWRQPLPWSCNWFPKLCYPRIVHYRGVPDGLPADDREVPEVKLGWLPPGHARAAEAATLEEGLDGRIADAAAPPLVLPLLRGGEAIALEGMTPDGPLVVQLPPQRPQIFLRAAGRVHELPVVPHRVLISTLEKGAYVVWHAAWHPDRPLPDRPSRRGESMAHHPRGDRGGGGRAPDRAARSGMSTRWMVFAGAVAVVAAALAFSAAGGSSGGPARGMTGPQVALAALLCALVVGGSIAFGLSASRGAAREREERLAAMKQAFTTLAQETGLTLTVPPDFQHPTQGPLASAASLSGEYRGFRVSAGPDGREDGYGSVSLDLRAPAGNRWPRRGRLDRGEPPTGTTEAARAALGRVTARERQPARAWLIELSAEALECSVESNPRGGVPGGADLKAILDELVELAQGLPR